MIAVLSLSLVIAIFASLAMAAVGFLLLRGKKKKETDPPAIAATPPLSDGILYKLCRSTTDCLGKDFDKSRPKGKMCDAKLGSAADATPFKFTKDGDQWVVATDCDGDGKYTSYLTRDSDLIWAKLDDPTKQRWTVDCTASGCAFKSKRDGKYLTGSFTAPVYSTTAEYYQMLKP